MSGGCDVDFGDNYACPCNYPTIVTCPNHSNVWIEKDNVRLWYKWNLRAHSLPIIHIVIPEESHKVYLFAYSMN